MTDDEKKTFLEGLNLDDCVVVLDDQETYSHLRGCCIFGHQVVEDNEIDSGKIEDAPRISIGALLIHARDTGFFEVVDDE